MKQKATNSNKHTIFRMFLIPLILIMLTQSLLTMGTLMLRHTFETIRDYSVSMMSRTVENRKVILENDLIQRCSSVNEQENVLNGLVRQYLEEQELSLEQALSSQESRQALLRLFFSECMDSIQGNQITGTFVILTDTDRETEGEYEGFLLRDSEPRVNTVNNTDLLFERGNKELARDLNVPLDTCWTTYFHMAESGQREADSFFYEPWRAGIQHPDADAADLGYWSKPFILEDDVNDSHEMITYSIPLRYEGRVYGVLGMEMASSFLYDYFPMAEINDSEQSGYLMAIQQEDGSYTALVGKGILYNTVTVDGMNFVLQEMGYDTLYRVEDTCLGPQEIYAVSCPLKLYDNFAPYRDVNWVLLGLNVEDDLFGISRRLYMWMSLAILFGLAFGMVGIYIIVHHLTKPIKNLIQCIHGGSAGLESYQPSNILEIDALYDVIEDLSARQKESANILLEEKERYRMALESTNDIFFTYDFQRQILDIVNHPTMSGTWEREGNVFWDMDKVYYEDRAMLRNLLEDIPDKIHVEFRFKFSEEEEFQWFELYGKVVNDAEGNRYKLMGGLRNIQEQKKQEALQQERAQKDNVTGFYLFEAGKERVGQCRAKQSGGSMIYLFLDKLQEMNEINGIIFGDMVLEELARVVRECCRKLVEKEPCQTVAIRIDGNEFAIWLECQQKKQVEAFVKDVLDDLNDLFIPQIFEIRVLVGVATASGSIGSVELMRMAKLAMLQLKEQGQGRYLFYGDISSRKKKKLPDIQGRQILSNDYGEEVNLASLALNLFGKGANLSAQMMLILRKIGYHYKASDVLATIVRPDFHSNYLEYQWHREKKPPMETVNQYTDKEWEAFSEWLGLVPVNSLLAEESHLPMLQKFLNVTEGQYGIVLPMYDSGSYMGNLCILGVDAALLENAEEKQKLVEVGSVIQSQLNQQQHDLASKAKSDFLSRMSHEIRTPMNGIIGMTAIALQNSQDRDRMVDCLNKIQDSSQYLLGLLNDILDMSKIESGKMHLEFENFDLQEMADSVAELLLPQMQAKEIEFVRKVELTHRWVLADKLRISQVLINLLGNAVKFTDRNGKIVLTVKEKHRNRSGESSRDKDALEYCPVEVYFAVADNGIGISKEDQKRVFRSFEQAKDASTISKKQGTGLGLSISSRLIQMMGGTVKLESEPGKGSRFSFEIAMEEGQPEEKVNLEKEKISFKGCRVLLVEDNELNVEIAKCLLEDYDFQVDCVYDGAQAVERIKTTAPGTYDVVLMDIMMPVMDGLEATRAIRRLDREDCRTLPIIAMSANAFDDDLKKSVECGMNGHLTKPVEVDKLYRMLKDILRP